MRYLLIFLLAWTASAQTPAGGSGAAPADVRSTPRSSVFGFLEATRQAEYRRAASFLQVPRAADGAELARQLKAVLDARLRTDPGVLSNAAEGDLTDGLAPDQELLGTITIDSRPVDLLLRRVELGDVRIWVVSSETLAQVPAMYRDIMSGWLERRIPEWLRAPGYLDTPLWGWTGLLALAALALLLGWALSALVRRISRPLVARTPTQFDDQLLASLANPIRLLFTVAIFRAGMQSLELSVLLRTYLGRILYALLYLALAWIAMRIIDIVGIKLLEGMTGRQRASASSMIPLAGRTLKVFAALIAVIATLDAWGYDTTALLAGLGVGGLAIALAAQKTIENLFGGVAITTDKPVLVGDFCRYGDKYGIVEDIGLRSTRVRTLDRTVVTIPNAQFSSMEIENYGRRDKIWFHPLLGLRRDTTPDQIRFLIGAFREVLLRHPMVDPNPARVRLVGVGQWSLDIEIFAYVKTASIDEFLVVQEELLLSLMEVIRDAGTALAVPQQLNVLTRDPLSIAARRGAVETV